MDIRKLEQYKGEQIKDCIDAILEYTGPRDYRAVVLNDTGPFHIDVDPRRVTVMVDDFFRVRRFVIG